MDGYIFYNKPLKLKKKRKNNHKEKENTEKNNSYDELENETSEIYLSDLSNNSQEIKFIGILKGHKGPVTSLVCLEDEDGIPVLFLAQKIQL